MVYWRLVSLLGFSEYWYLSEQVSPGQVNVCVGMCMCTFLVCISSTAEVVVAPKVPEMHGKLQMCRSGARCEEELRVLDMAFFVKR